MALRPTYWEWRAELEASRARWRVGTLALGVGAIGLIGLLLWTALRPTPVYFVIPGSLGPLSALGLRDRVPPEVVEAFAAEAAMTAGNLMPATARRSYERLRTYLAAPLQRTMASEAQADLAAIAERLLSTSFTVRQSRVVAQAPTHWTVKVAGVRRSWTGAQLMSEEDIVYRFAVAHRLASARNISGLEITEMSVGRPPTPGSKEGPVEARESRTP